MSKIKNYCYLVIFSFFSFNVMAEQEDLIKKLEVAPVMPGLVVAAHPQNNKILQVKHEKMSEAKAYEIMALWRTEMGMDVVRKIKFRLISFENNKSGRKWVYYSLNNKNQLNNIQKQNVAVRR